MTTTTTNTEKTTTTKNNKKIKAEHNEVWKAIKARKTIAKDEYDKEHNVNNAFNCDLLSHVENGKHTWKLITDTCKECASYANKEIKNLALLDSKHKQGRTLAEKYAKVIQLIWTVSDMPIDKCPKMTAEVINNFRSKLERMEYHRTDKAIKANNGTMSISWKDWNAWKELGADLVSCTLNNYSWKTAHDNNDKITAREDKDKARKAEKERKEKERKARADEKHANMPIANNTTKSTTKKTTTKSTNNTKK